MKNFYKSNVLLASISALIVILILVDVYVFRNEPMMFWITLPVLLGVSGLTLGKLLQIRQSEYWYLEQLGEEIRVTNQKTLIDFPLPMCIVDNEGCVIWSNDCFDNTFFVPTEDKSSVEAITDIPLELFGSEGREICYGENWYRVYSNPHQFKLDDKIGGKNFLDGTDPNEKITMLIFRDITDFKQMKQAYDMSRPVVVIVVVDNYEELLSGAKESNRASVTSQVDQLIEEYFYEKKAVLEKTKGDKFLIVLEQQYLDEMIKDKMAIINKAHEIVVPNKGVVTLSIGIGTTGKDLNDSERIAAEMLEKALDRGGDQAIVKTQNGFEAFGANSPGKERTGKVKIRLAAENIKSLIGTADTVYIMGHAYSDFDSAGSALGLTCAIRRLGIPAYTVADTRTGKTNAKSLFDRFSEYDGLVQDPEKVRQWITPKSVLIVVDTHILRNLEDPELYEAVQKSRVVIIDHHRLSNGAITDYSVRCHEPNASSACELVTEIIQYFSNDVLLDKEAAGALLAGITLDTKDFVMRTSVSTFEAAAYLKKIGADTISVKKLFDTTIEQRKKKAEIISSAYIYRATCAIAVVENSFPGVRVLCSQAADEMLYFSNVDASFTVYPIENGWSISARSLGKVNVQTIMENMSEKKVDGGGHQSMAGAQLYDVSKEEVVAKLQSVIDDYFTTTPDEE